MSSPSLIANRSLWARLGALDPRYPVSFLITLILVLGEARYGILGGYDRLVAALGVSTAGARAVTLAAGTGRERAERLHHGDQSRPADQAARPSALAVRPGRLPRD